MTEHTIDEFRSKNKYGHNSKGKENKKKYGTPISKKLGNSSKICNYCYPKLSTRLHNKKFIKKQLNTLNIYRYNDVYL